MNPLYIKNNQVCGLCEIPVAGWDEFAAEVRAMLADSQCHCVNYFAFKVQDGLQLIMCIAKDNTSSIAVLGHVAPGSEIPSLQVEAVDRFEREIAENFKVVFTGHRWPKPVRTAPDDYPFYRSADEEHHEVGVGPIHAGVIEPGHFRFTCEGEKILNLEIMLGYQHRGVEPLMVSLPRLDQKALLAEDIAGDTAVGHSVAFASVVESLSGFEPDRGIIYARMLALELERIAIHTGDLSAICGDVAYQLGNAVYGRLRTPIINFMQKWCGNRLGKTSVRPFEAPYPFTKEIAADLLKTLKAFEKDFDQMSRQVRHFPSVLSRLEKTGTVPYEDALAVGAVGMAARASGLCRDIRKSHPYLLYQSTDDTVVKHHGDVYSRTQVRMEEVMNSLALVRRLVAEWPWDEEEAVTASSSSSSSSSAASSSAVASSSAAASASSFTSAGQPGSGKELQFAPGSGRELRLAPSSFVVSLVEGWRGEICHTAITAPDGTLALYKVKDPSFHNWRMLELAVRNNEISDFPICNKSFNLSYCGHDL